MTLQQRLDAFKSAFESGAPPYSAPREAIETMHRATEDLRRSGLAERALKVGDLAPAFELTNQEALQAVWPQLHAMGASLVAISPELSQYGRAVRRRAKLEFDVLTDLHLRVTEASADVNPGYTVRPEPGDTVAVVGRSSRPGSPSL